MAPPPGPGVVAKKAAAENTQLNAKHYIVAALTATLATALVVTAVFVALSPARIYFSVTYAASQALPGNNGGVRLLLTVAANNTSRRARVEYESLFVDVSNFSTGPLWTNWIRATAALPFPLHQPTLNVTSINATVDLVGDAATDFTGNMTSSFTVMVTSLAKFRIGFAPTRLYEIMVSCRPVRFFPNPNPKAPTPPVQCS